MDLGGLTVDDGLNTLDLAPRAREGVCALCAHSAGSASPTIGSVIRSWFGAPPRAATCGSRDADEDWERSGGVGPVSVCRCRDAFHGS